VEIISADLESGKASTSAFDADATEEEDDAPTSRQSPPKRRKSADCDEIRLF
jgi:hypothetical protein